MATSLPAGGPDRVTFFPHPSARSVLVSVLAVLGCFSIFLLILFLAYLPAKPQPLPDGVRTPEERKAALAELRGREQQAASTYGWIDQPAGVVRLPIDRAIELVVQEHARPQR
jgi:hypothetical protein